MLHKEFWGLLFLGFLVWVFVAGNPTDRIDHFCRPVAWSGNAITSLSALAIPTQQKNVDQWFRKFEYGCRYMTWRLFYQDEYNAYMATRNSMDAITAPERSAAPAAPAKPLSPTPDKDTPSDAVTP